MSEEEIKIVEDLLNINPREMTYEQLKSMQNGWWETLNLLSEQNKENKQLKDQLQQKENIIKEVREKTKENQEYLESAKEMYINQNNEILKTHTLQLINNSLVQNDKLLEILDKVDKGE